LRARNEVVRAELDHAELEGAVVAGCCGCVGELQRTLATEVFAVRYGVRFARANRMSSHAVVNAR
jgi:hypothetical protein